MVTKFRVLRNPNPLLQHEDYVREYNELSMLRDKKWEELEDVTRRLRRYAKLIRLSADKLKRYVE